MAFVQTSREARARIADVGAIRTSLAQRDDLENIIPRECIRVNDE